MKERFEGADNRRRLIEALKLQKLVGGSDGIARGLADHGELMEIAAGAPLITMGDSGDDAYLVLLGSFSVTIRGTEVATRGPGDHVGEQALLDPLQKRSATVTAREDSVVLRITEAALDTLAREHPEVWKSLAVELSRRLVARNDLIEPVNDEIEIFLICAKEALPVAQEIQSALMAPGGIICTLWTDGIFRAGNYPLESLEAALAGKDFAVAVAGADDFVESRGKEYVAPRDNVLFELGLFMGKLGRTKAILMEPRAEAVKLPSDLAGLTTIPYKVAPSSKLPVVLAPAIHELRKIINERCPPQNKRAA